MFFFNYTKCFRNNNVKTSVNTKQTLSTFHFQVDDTYKIVEKIKKLKTNKYHAKYWLCNKDIYITKLSRPLTFIGIKTKDSCSRWTCPNTFQVSGLTRQFKKDIFSYHSQNILRHICITITN